MAIQECHEPRAGVDGRNPGTRLTPEFIRLPAPGSACPWTGLKRTALNQLVLPCVENEFKPLVRSFVLRKRGQRTGIRLIDFESLVTHIRSQGEMD